MSIRFVYGRAGIGKSAWCINSIAESINKDEDHKLILIVPEQYTFNTENKILKSIGEPALLRTHVLSFKKMAHEVFEECGGRVKQIIKESGRNMLIHKVLNDKIESLEYFRKISREQGFYEIVSDVISEFKKYNVNVETLRDMQESIQDPELYNKVKELSVIYEAFNEEMNEGYIDGDDELTLLSRKLLEDDIYTGSEVWIDEFSTFTPQQLEIIRILAKRCRRVNITLSVDNLSLIHI